VVSTKLAGIFETFGVDSGVTWVDGPAEVLAEAVVLAGDGARCKAMVQKQTAAVTRLLSVDRAVDEFEALLTRHIGGLK
jgi:hypothetical protein